MNPEEVRAIAKEAAEEAVSKLLITLGINADDFVEAQADTRFVRKLRLASEALPRWTLKAAVSTFATGVVGYLLILWGWQPK